MYNKNVAQQPVQQQQQEMLPIPAMGTNLQNTFYNVQQNYRTAQQPQVSVNNRNCSKQQTALCIILNAFSILSSQQQQQQIIVQQQAPQQQYIMVPQQQFNMAQQPQQQQVPPSAATLAF